MASFSFAAAWPLIGFGIGIAGFMAYLGFAAVHSQKRREALEADRKRDVAPDDVDRQLRQQEDIRRAELSRANYARRFRSVNARRKVKAADIRKGR